MKYMKTTNLLILFGILLLISLLLIDANQVTLTRDWVALLLLECLIQLLIQQKQ